MAKAPREGSVKTRLGRDLGAESAAALARAFLSDTWSSIVRLDWATAVLAGDAPDMGVPGATVWAQGDGDLGARLERVVQRALRDAPAVILLGADTPGLPPDRLEGARRALDASDAVIGPSADGGFYLLGLRRCPPQLLAELPWSSPETFARTSARLRAVGLTVTELEPWFDVDELNDLRRLAGLAAEGAVEVPATLRALRDLGLTGAPFERTSP